MARKDGSSKSIQQALSRAMIKPLKVTANLGEMLVKGTMKDYASANLPAFTGMLEVNSDIGRGIVYFVRNPKDSISRAFDQVDNTETVQTAKQLLKYAVADLKSGEFYKEFRDRDGSMGLMDDFGGVDFGNFDIDGNWDDSSEADVSTEAAYDIAEKQDVADNRRTEAMLAAIGTSTEATNRTNLAIHKEDIRTALKRHSQTMTQLTNITTVTSAIYETMNNHLVAMTEMSREMNKGIMGELTQMRQILTEMRDHQIPKKSETRERESKSPFDFSTGALDLKKYAKVVKGNLENNTELGLMTSMLGMFSPEMIGMSFSDNPLQVIMDAAVSAIIPKSTKKKLGKLNKTAEGFFPSLLARVFDYGQNNYDFKGDLAKVFGYKEDSSVYINPADYNKDKVDFSGKIAKAITEVMPTQLGKIISLLSGSPTQVFNYDTGKFVNSERTFMEYNRKNYDLAGRMYDTRNAFDARINSPDLKISKKDKTDLRNGIYNLLQETAENGTFLNPQKGFDAFNQLWPTARNNEDYGIREIAFAILKSMSPDELMTINSEVASSRRDRKMNARRIGRDLDSSGMYALYNGMTLGGQHRDALAKRSLYGSDSISGMNDETYKSFTSDITGKFKPSSMMDTMSSILAAINRGVIVYSYDTHGQGVAGLDAALDAQKNTLKNSAVTATRRAFDDYNSQEDRKRQTESERGTFDEEIISTGKNRSVGLDSTIDEMVAAFTDPETSTRRVYKNAEDQSRYDKQRSHIDAISSKVKSKMGFVERVQSAIAKPFNLLERGISFMDRAMFRAVYGDEATGLFENGDDSDHSLMSSITTVMKANLTKFSDWFKTTIMDKFFTGDDALFPKVKDKLAEWVGDPLKDKAKDRMRRLGIQFFGEKDSDGNYSGGKLSTQVNAVRDGAGEAKGLVKSQISGFMDNFRDSLNTMLYGDDGEWHQTKTIAEDGTITWGRSHQQKGTTGIVGMFKDAGTRMKDFLFGTDDDNESKQLWAKVKDEAKVALPGAGAGAIMGGVGTLGAGLLGGLWLPGGPIFGAMIGSAAGFIGASDKLKDHLFGKVDENDPEGKRVGGLIDQNVQTAVKKYVPSLGVGAAIGAVAGNFGILPAGIGPVAGAAIGSFGGMISANTELREVLFGKEEDDDSGYISKNTRKKMVKSLPGVLLGGMGINAIVGSMGGMGLLPSLLTTPAGPIVTAVGAVAGTFAGPKLENFFFGEKDEHGEYIAGKEGVFAKVFNFSKNKLFDPFFTRMNEMAHGIGDWFSDSIMAPLKSAMDPIKEQMKQGGGFIAKAFKGFGNILKGAVDHVFEKSFGKPLSEIADNVAKKTGQLVNFVTTSIGKAVGKVVAMPFTLLGMYGKHLSKKQEKNRNKRFAAWHKDNPEGTEEQFAEYERSTEGFSISRLVEDSFNKVDEKAAEKKLDRHDARGKSSDKPIIDVTDLRKRKTDESLESFGLTMKAQKANDKTNPPNSAETRSATALEKIESKIDNIVDVIRGKVDPETKKNSSLTGSRRSRKRGKSSSSISPLDDDVNRAAPSPVETVAMKASSMRTDGSVDGTDVSRSSKLYKSLYQRFNSVIENSKNPQRAVDDIVTSAPTEHQDIYRMVLKDIAVLNNPTGSSNGGTFGGNSSESESGDIKGFLSSNTALLGGIAGLVLSMMGGDGNAIGAIITGALGAKLASKVVKFGKGVWNFGKKAVTATKNAWGKFTSPVGQVAASAGASLYQLSDYTNTNDSIGAHNMWNATSKFITSTAKGQALDNTLGKIVGNFGKKTAETVAEDVSKDTVTSLTKRISTAVVSKVKSVTQSDIVKKIAGTKFASKLGSVGSKVAQFIAEHVPTALKKSTGATARQASSIPHVGLIIFATFGVWDFFTGMGDAYKYFGIKPSEASLGMKISSGLCKLVVGMLTAVPKVGMLLSLIPVAPLAKGLYGIFADDEADAKLASQQSNMEAQVTSYNEANGTEYSVSEYLEKVDADTGEEKPEGWFQKAKNAVSNFFSGNKTTTTTSGNRVDTTEKPPSGIKCTFKVVDGKTHYYLTKSEYEKWKGTGTGRGRWGRGNAVFDQTDPKWNRQDPSMKDAGCGPTVAAMMADRLGRGPDPVEASQMAYAGGYRAADGGTDPNFFSAYGASKGVDMYQGSTNAASIGSSLSQGNPVALMGQGGAFGSGMHYMLADKMAGNSVEVVDPIGGKRVRSSLSALANKTSTAIYGSGRGRPLFGRGAVQPKSAAEAKAMTNMPLDANKLSRKTARIGKTLPVGYGRGRWGRGTAKEQAAKVLEIAEDEIGYVEKASNSNLDDKTANKGTQNYTKYGAWFGLNGPGAPWCAMFVSWCCSKAGVSTSVVPKTASVAEFTRFAKANKSFHTKSGYTPQPGDIIIYGSSGSDHTGLVYGTDGSNVITIEGNTGSGNVSEGGCAKKKSVPLNEAWIYGYFTPAYDGKTISFDGGSSGSSAGSSDEDSESSSSGLTKVAENISKAVSTFTDPITKIADSFTNTLGKFLGNASGEDAEESGTSTSSGNTTLTGGSSSYSKYPKLTEAQKKEIATVITGETGGSDIYAARQEASQIANLTERQYGQDATPEELIKKLNSGWYAKSSWTRGVTDIAKTAVDDVLVQGKRTLPRYVVEHDMFPGDIKSAKSRSAYKKGDSVSNIYGSNYKFYDFFGKDKTGDISGYFQSDYDKFKTDKPWGAGPGLTDGMMSTAKSLNHKIVSGRGKAEEQAHVSAVTEAMKATASACGKGAADNQLMERIVSIFEQVVPILQKIEENTSKHQVVATPSAGTGKGSTGRKQTVNRATPVVKAPASKDRLGSIYDVGSTAIDKITSR